MATVEEMDRHWSLDMIFDANDHLDYMADVETYMQGPMPAPPKPAGGAGR